MALPRNGSPSSVKIMKTWRKQTDLAWNRLGVPISATIHHPTSVSGRGTGGIRLGQPRECSALVS